jgi:hypothetical protein
VWALLRGCYHERVHADMHCEVLAAESELFTLRVRGVSMANASKLGKVMHFSPDTLRSYTIDAGAEDRARRGLDVHLVLVRCRSGGAGGGGAPAASGVPRKRAAPASEGDSSSGDGDDDDAPPVATRGRKSRPEGGEVPVSAAVPAARVTVERPAVLPRAVLEAVDRDDRPSVTALATAVCNSDRSMPRIELTVVSTARHYLLVFTGARLHDWPFVKYVRGRFPAVADVQLAVRRPEALARNLLGDGAEDAEVAEFSAEWTDTLGSDGRLCALVVTLVRATAFADGGGGAEPA